MDYITNLSQEFYPISLLVGIILLVIGGSLLVDGAVSVARQLGVSTLVIGLTVVAFSTSSPELALNIVASLNGHSDLGFGNVIGSNIANIGLVLGIGILICSEPWKESKEFLWLFGFTAAVCLISYVASSSSAPTLFQDLGWSWAILLLLFFCFKMWKWFQLGKAEHDKKQSGEITPDGQTSSTAAWVMLVGGLLLLGIGGKATELGAVSLATNLGVSEIVIGSTVVAIATSLPEVVTTIMAARRQEIGLAVGNVVGSNLCNLLLVLPITMLIQPVELEPLSLPSSANDPWVYIGAMLGFTLLAYIMAFTGNSFKRTEGGVLVLLYVCFLVGITIWNSVG